MSEVVPELAMAESRAQLADNAIEQLQFHLDFLKSRAKGAETEEIRQLTCENDQLRLKVRQLTQDLEALEVANGATLVPLPGPVKTPAITSALVSPSPLKTVHPVEDAGAPPAKKPKMEAGKPAEVSPLVTPEKKKERAAAAEKDAKGGDSKKKKKAEASGGASGGKGGKQQEAAPVDFSRLDVRVGKIIAAKKHPEADGLYVEEVDLGEEKTRTICSGLVPFMPVEALQNRIALFCCNLKTAMLRGIPSQGMILCAEGKTCEIIAPPAGAQPGDRVTVPAFPGTPDAQLNPKRKIVEKLKPDLRTNDECIACYKGSPFTIEGKGICKVETLANCQIK